MKNDLKNIINRYIISKSDKIKISSNDIKKNDIFIALKGQKKHGNKFIDDAFKAGAKYCITDKKSNFKSNKEKILLVDNIYYYLRELSIKKRLSFSGQVIGITGSAGKTSLKEFLKFFLKKKFKVSASIKSYNNNLGVMLSILNMNIDSDFAIFEIGTNDFFEIRDLTKLVKPSHIFITNILSSHLENFKTKKNIAIEKSDIFNKKFNQNAKVLYLQVNSSYEKIIYNIANKQKINKIIRIGKIGLDSYIDNIRFKKNKYKINLKILNKFITIELIKYEEHQLKNLIFVLTFLIQNQINLNLIIKNKIKLPAIEGRGSIHNIFLNGVKIKLIDQSYNANPETMIQCIKHFSEISEKNYQKILLLGDMNELGIKKDNLHFKVIEEVEKHLFDKVILSGDLFKKALSMFSKLNNKYVYRATSQNIMSYLSNKVHKKAILMAKCSNATEVNKLVKLLKYKNKEKFV